ncbi:Uncharacterized protein LW93_5697 [Fusarium fujikuroi]|nr:Uncharacterized protein LW93_5697 [Fusarium fujikuroi]
MPAYKQSSRRDPSKVGSQQECDGRIQDWLSDSGLDIQRRLLTGGCSQREPLSPAPEKHNMAKSADLKARL